MVSFNPGYTAEHTNWNFSNQQKEGYSEDLIGTVVAIQFVQAIDYMSKQPKFWQDGNPVMNIRLALANPDGDLVCFTFAKASKAAREGKKPSIHMDLWHLTGDTDMINLIGKTIHIHTWPANPNTGQAWGNGNPRLFSVELVTDQGPFELKHPLSDAYKVPEVFANGGAKPAQPAPQPQYQQPQYGYAQPMQQMYQAQPIQPVQVPQQIPPMQQPAMAPQQQQMYDPMQPQVPQGMDPNVAAAMQQMGATNVQPMVQPQSVYDDSIPF